MGVVGVIDSAWKICLLQEKDVHEVQVFAGKFARSSVFRCCSVRLSVDVDVGLCEVGISLLGDRANVENTMDAEQSWVDQKQICIPLGAADICMVGFSDHVAGQGQPAKHKCSIHT